MSKKSDELTVPVTIRVPASEKAAWEVDASQKGQSMTTWIRRACAAVTDACVAMAESTEKKRGKK